MIDGLKYNLLNISQLCDNGYKLEFEGDTCNILNKKDGKIVLTARREGNVYVLYLGEIVTKRVKCLTEYQEDGNLWHKRLGHIGMDLLKRLSTQELVRSRLKMSSEKTHLCDTCQYGKQIKISFKPKKMISTPKPLELIIWILLVQ